MLHLLASTFGAADVVVILLSTATALGVAAAPIAVVWMNRKTNAKVDQGIEKIEAVHSEVRTNHGKQAREYLEMLEPLTEAVQALQRGQERQFDRDKEVKRLLAVHTEEDEQRFATIQSSLTELADAVRAV